MVPARATPGQRQWPESALVPLARAFCCPMPNRQVAIDALPKSDHFWMCWVEHKSTPLRHHASLAAACIEADRLATKTGKRVFILERIGCVIPEVLKE